MFNWALVKADWRERYKLICMSIKYHKFYDPDSYQKWYWQWLYTSKSIACILLDRFNDDPDMLEAITTLIWGTHGVGHHEFLNYIEWEYLVVGEGLWRNWWYSTGTDSSH